jgi:hypothetical protein
MIADHSAVIVTPFSLDRNAHHPLSKKQSGTPFDQLKIFFLFMLRAH